MKLTLGAIHIFNEFKIKQGLLLLCFIYIPGSQNCAMYLLFYPNWIILCIYNMTKTRLTYFVGIFGVWSQYSGTGAKPLKYVPPNT